MRYLKGKFEGKFPRIKNQFHHNADREKGRRLLKTNLEVNT